MCGILLNYRIFLIISNDLEQTQYYQKIPFISSLTYQSIVNCINQPMCPRVTTVRISQSSIPTHALI